MSEEFEEQKLQLQLTYADLTIEKRQELLSWLKEEKPRSFAKLEKIKHSCLLLEARRAQLEIEENTIELRAVERKLLERKETFLQLLTVNQKNRG
ncbi:MAG: AAA family ATPase [Enterococcus sp.]